MFYIVIGALIANVMFLYTLGFVVREDIKHYQHDNRNLRARLNNANAELALINDGLRSRKERDAAAINDW